NWLKGKMGGPKNNRVNSWVGCRLHQLLAGEVSARDPCDGGIDQRWRGVSICQRSNKLLVSDDPLSGIGHPSQVRGDLCHPLIRGIRAPYDQCTIVVIVLPKA